MLNRKSVFVIVMALVAAPTMLMGQVRPGVTPGAQGMTVEQSYLQQSVEMMIIREQSRSDSRDMKFVALEYISDAIGRGNRSDEIASALEFLSMEGIINVTRESGRVVNNFPDVRKAAATQLGQLATPAATSTLIRMVSVDNEPMVITEAIRALGNIGFNDNNQVSSIIAWNAQRFHSLAPDNFIALSAIDAFEKLAIANNGLSDRLAIELLMRISDDGRYIAPVRNRARDLLEDLKRFEQQQYSQ